MKKSHKKCKTENLRISNNRKDPRKQPQMKLDARVRAKIRELATLLKDQDGKCWEIGDLVIDLMGNEYLSLGQIAQLTNYSKTRISHFHLTARIFGPDQRKGYTFQDSLTARQVHLSLPRLYMTPLQIRKKIVKMRNKTTKQVRSYFVHLLIKREMDKSLAKSTKTQFSKKGQLINGCHHSDWQNIIPKLLPRSVSLYICDPAFGYTEYIEGNHLSYKAKAGPMRTDCDNSSPEQALAATLPLFQLCLPKLAEGGTLLLFQPGGRPDRLEVLQAANDNGWDCVYGLTWQKGSLTTGNFRHPYRICTERILIFTRKGERIRKGADGLPVSTILDFRTETSSMGKKMQSGQTEYGHYHLFQKPPALMEFLVAHHSYPGDLVCTPFGCSGAGAIAASKLNRRWVYIESNKNNFLYGSERIYKAIKTQSTKVG